MQINFYLVRKYVSLLLTALVPLFVFTLFMSILKSDIIYALIGVVAAIAVCILIFNAMTRHAFTQMMEGKGLLMFSFDSRGVMQPYILKVRPGYMEQPQMGIQTSFDRNAIFQMYPAREAETTEMVIAKNGKQYRQLTILYDMSKEHDINFSFMHYPTLLYNQNLGEFITKDALNDMEEEAIIRHSVLYLKKKVEELSSIMRDFARHVIEHLNPNRGINPLKKYWWVILIVGILLLAMLFLMGGGADTVTSMIPAASGGGGIVQTR